MKSLSAQLGIIVFLLSILLFFGYSSGPASVSGNGYTGAPDEDFTCGGCHNSGSFGEPIVNITVSETNGGANIVSYLPGQSYFVSVSVAPSMGTPAAYGFQTVFLQDGSNESTGTFTDADGNSQFVLGTSGRTYAEHNQRTASGTWQFKWTAPAAGTGDVNIFIVGNTVNNMSGTVGDNGSTTPTTLTISDRSLPVELTEFNARTEKRKVEISWATAAEDKVSHFELERSQNGTAFTSLTRIAAHGSSAVTRNYRTMDATAPSGQNFYRLRMVDLDGSFSYSPVVSATVENLLTRLGAYPNPTRGMLRFREGIATGTSLILRDATGRPLWTGTVGNGLDLSHYPAGVYLLEALSDGERTIESIIKR